MMNDMSRLTTGRKWVVILAGLCSYAAVPTTATAWELEIDHDARLEGYGEGSVLLEESNLTLPWLGFGLISAIALLGMFKDAKRSHLD